MGNRPSLGRTREQRGLDQFDTPPIALAPLFFHEPLLAGVTSVCEPFAGKGNLVMAMRGRGLVVHASDIEYRGCPDSVLDFFEMTERPPDCDVLVSNPPFSRAMEIIEHAWALGFRVVILLLKIQFLNTEERYERMHKRGHLRRVCPFAERLQDMHDAKHLAAGGKKASQSQEHAWFVFDRDYCGLSTNNPVSINHPAERMPWLRAGGICRICEQCAKAYEPQRSSSRFCSPACKQQAYRKRLSVTPGVTPSPSDCSEFRYVRHAEVPRFMAEGWELLPALDGTHQGKYSALMRRRQRFVAPH
jgi:hypothetical protein